MGKVDADIASLCLEPIAFKACMDEDWSIEEVDAAEAQYRVFLHAIRHHKGELAPSKIVDKFWHHHILDTEKYIEDCNYIFGRYIHHYPYSGLMGEEDAQQQEERFKNSQHVVSSIML